MLLRPPLGWLSDDDLTPSLRAQQGWAGALSLPRELFWQITRDVVGTLKTPLADLAGCEVVASGQSSTVRTLGIRPVVELENLRGTEVDLTRDKVQPSLGWEAEMIIDVEGYSEVGLLLSFPQGTSFQACPSLRRLGEARISFRPDDERLIVSRTTSTSIPSILTEPEHGRHTLFRTTTLGLEPLHIRVFFDSTLLEVFANDRFALSTHLYGGECAVTPYTVPPPANSIQAEKMQARACQVINR